MGYIHKRLNHNDMKTFIFILLTIIYAMDMSAQTKGRQFVEEGKYWDCGSEHWNNPLKYNDQSGEFFHLIIGAVLGGMINWIAGFWGTSSATIAISSFVSGAAIGGAAGVSGGFVTGFGNSLIDGNSFSKPLGQGCLDGLIGGVGSGLIGGITGGIHAQLDGRRFWDGATLISVKYYIM